MKYFISLTGAAVVMLALAAGCGGNRPGPDASGIPPIDAAVAERQLSQHVPGAAVSVVMVVIAVAMQVASWIAAVRKLSSISSAPSQTQEKFLQLDAVEVYFDLPLYFGLLGTVMSFLLITVFPDAGLMFAYVSTALGIVVSVILRLVYLTPYKQKLIVAASEMGHIPQDRPTGEVPVEDTTADDLQTAQPRPFLKLFGR